MIGDKIRTLRNKSGLTQQELADRLDISSSAIGMYEQNRRLPDINIIKQLTGLFDVTSDYLLGIEHISTVSTDINESYTINKFEMDVTFSERFLTLYHEHGLSSETEEKALNLQHNQIINMQYNNQMPTLSELLKISSYFQVSIDYLLGRSNFQNIILADDEELLFYYKQLSKLDQKYIMGNIAALIKTNDGTSIFTDDNISKIIKPSSPSINGEEKQ